MNLRAGIQKYNDLITEVYSHWIYEYLDTRRCEYIRVQGKKSIDTGKQG